MALKQDGSSCRASLGNDYGGLVMMSNPENYNHPEPLRIWDEKANGGRGDMFANFATTKDKDWLLEPGKTYHVKIPASCISMESLMQYKAEHAWQYYAHSSIYKSFKIKIILQKY